MTDTEKTIEEWIEKRFKELNDRSDEIDKEVPQLQQQLNNLGKEQLSIRGGLVELRKLKENHLGIIDKPEEEAK